jgi:hypothetical protein
MNSRAVAANEGLKHAIDVNHRYTDFPAAAFAIFTSSKRESVRGVRRQAMGGDECLRVPDCGSTHR